VLGVLQWQSKQRYVGAGMLFPLLLLITAVRAWAVDAKCISSLNEIWDLEVFVTPSSTESNRREYILCPGQDYVTGFLVDDDVVGGSNPLFVRSNATVKCGVDGKRENNCTIKTGSFGLFVNVFAEEDDGLMLDNVVLQGLTFQNLRKHAFYLEGYGGKIEVLDCAFLNSTNVGNIVAIGVIPPDIRGRRGLGSGGTSRHSRLLTPYYSSPDTSDHRKLQNEYDYPLLDLTFTNCLFSGNQGPNSSLDDPFGIHLVFTMFLWQKTSFIGCKFQNNHFGDKKNLSVSSTLMNETTDSTYSNLTHTLCFA
jgi:hypothetical protein